MTNLISSNGVNYGLSHAYINGETVTQGHADYCAANGHATYVLKGVDQGVCPRCGDDSTPAPAATDETFRAILKAHSTYRQGRASVSLGRTLEDQRIHGPRLMEIGREKMAEITASMDRTDAEAFVAWLRKEGML